MSLLFISTVFSTRTATTAIGSSGTIAATSTASPLYVDGNQIKDANGNIVYLRGVCKTDLSSVDGDWYAGAYWTEAYAREEMNAIKSWGANVVRIHIAISDFKNNILTADGVTHYKQAMARLLTIADELSMYVIMDGYSVLSGSWQGQDAGPYPPYQNDPAAASVIGSEQDFINWWADMANTFKNHPSAIFDIWNEPHDPFPKATYFSTVQKCISAIRATGSTNVVMVNWDWGCWVDLAGPWVNSLSWVFNYPLTGTNIVYETHLYQNPGSGNGCIFNSAQGYKKYYDYATVDYALGLTRYYDVAAQYPLVIGEIGAALGGADHNDELLFFSNALALFNLHGIGYCGFNWCTGYAMPLLSSRMPYVANEAGDVIKTALAYVT